MKIKYIFFTRFKLQMRNEKAYSKTNIKDWFEKRIQLFKNICYPSVMSQTNKNFEWFVFSTEGYIAEKEKEILNEFKGLKQIFCTRPNNQLVTIKDNDDLPSKMDIIPAVMSSIKDEKLIITTRIDSDDALSPYFIENVLKIAYKHMNREEPIIISPSEGIQYYKNGQFWYRKRKYSNAFISVFEPINEKNMFTVYHKNHLDMKKVMKMDFVTKPYMWLQSINETNIFNRPCGHQRVSRRTAFEKYNIKRLEEKNG